MAETTEPTGRPDQSGGGRGERGRGRQRRVTELTVLGTEELTPHMVRVRAGGTGFDSFASNGFTDAYIKLLVDPGEASRSERTSGLADDAAAGPLTRTYTVRSVDTERREIAVDFVVHGDEGIAAQWAQSVKPGEPMRFFGPGGAYAPREDADWHLLAGDEAALPAIAAAVEALPADARAQVYVEVAGPDEEIEIAAGPGVQVHWVHRGVASSQIPDDLAGAHAPLVAAVRAGQWLDGQVHAFVHGESEVVMRNLRRYLRNERGIAPEWLSVSGYWRRGRTEEGFREWKREFVEAES